MQNHGWAQQLDEMEAVVRWLRESVPYIGEVAAALVAALREDGRLYIFGNGGSASQAQHFATELTGRFRSNRRALPAQALNADGSLLTCIANDFDYDDVFSRQVEAFGRPGDVAIGLTTSGRSAMSFVASRRPGEAGCERSVFAAGTMKCSVNFATSSSLSLPATPLVYRKGT